MPGTASSPTNTGRSATTPGNRAGNLRIGNLRLRRREFGLGRFQLRRDHFHVLHPADRLDRGQMRLRRIKLALGLRVGDARLVHQAPRDRALLQQFLPAFQQLLRRIHGFLGRCHIRLRLANFIRNRRIGHVAKRCFGLIHGRFGIRDRRGQVAILELRDQLALPHVIAPIHQKPLHRSADLGRNTGLVQRAQDAVHGDDAVDGIAFGFRQLHRPGRFFLLRRVFLVGRTPRQSRLVIKPSIKLTFSPAVFGCQFMELVPSRQDFDIALRQTVAREPVIVGVASVRGGGLGIHHFQRRRLARLVS